MKAKPGDGLRKRLAVRLAALAALAIEKRKRARWRPLPIFEERPDAADQFAHILATYIESLAEALVPDVRIRSAALDRPELAARWDLHDTPPTAPPVVDELLSDLAVAEDRHNNQEAAPYWPENMSPRALAEALERTGDADAAIVAREVRAGRIGAEAGRPTFAPDLYTGEALRADEPAERAPIDMIDAAAVEEIMRRADETRAMLQAVGHGRADIFTGRRVSPELDRALQRWPIIACARIVSAELSVREDRARRVVPIPSTDVARAAIRVLSQGDEGPWIKRPLTNGTLELVWDGKPKPYNLSLDLGPGFEGALVRGILAELAADGLRDWLVLHRMAAEQGRSGALTWRWSEHRERTAYDRRIRSDNASDAEQADAVTRRLFRLKRAELKQSIRRTDGKLAWARIGPHGLLDIPAAVEEADRSLELARLTINPALYSGAKVDAEEPHFTLLPDSVLALDGETLRLATLVAIQLRYARDNGGTSTLKASTLWEWWGRDASKRKHWPRLNERLARALDTLGERGVLGGWDREAGAPGPEARYELHAPAWWRDQVIHHVPPELPPSRATLPRTGEELRAWRSAHGLSQAAAAGALGVGKRTIARAELAPAEPLGRALATALATWEPEP